MTNRVGQQFGNYRLIRLLGSGGFAEVYLGEHTHLHTQAAIKVLEQLTPQGEQDFLEEARRLARLKHPHIIKVLDFNIEKGVPFLVMDFASDGTLRDRHPRGIQLPLSMILSYVIQIADALQYAHNEKIIHRDIKPENMLVAANNEVLLSDFGIAVVIKSTQSQSTKDIVGTFEYMAPEQFRGKPLPASDQYALACVIYEWISGTCVFSGTPVELIAQHLADPPPSLSSKAPTILPTVDQVVLKALSKDPQQRFTSVQEFALELEQACQSKQTIKVVPQPSSPSPAIPPTTPVISAPPGSLLYSYSDHSEGITALSWSPNGEYIASKGINQTVLIWNVVSRSKSYASTYQTSFWKSLLGQTAIITAWSPNGGYLAIGNNDGSIQIVEAATGKTPITYRGHTQSIEAITWSPNGVRIVSKESKGVSHLWSLNSALKELALSGCVVLSPDGNLITSTGNDRTVQVWNVLTRSKIFTYRGHSGVVKSLAWSSDGSRIASGGDDGKIWIWNTISGGYILTISKESKTNALLWSPDDQYIASTAVHWGYEYTNSYVIVHSARDGRQRGYYQGQQVANQIYRLMWSPDGNSIVFWDTNECVNIFHWHSSYGTNQPIFAYVGHSELSPNGKIIATASDDKTLQIWNASNGMLLFTYLGHPGKVTAIAWSPDSRRVATGTDEGIVRIWQAV